MTLTKDKLIIQIQNQINLTKPESRQLIEQLLEIMKTTLANGEDVLISGFGKFSVRNKRARRGRNPQTKERMILRERKVLVFRTSGVLKHRINITLADSIKK
jgi:integration host factor subunit alpha